MKAIPNPRRIIRTHVEAHREAAQTARRNDLDVRVESFIIVEHDFDLDRDGEFELKGSARTAAPIEQLDGDLGISISTERSAEADGTVRQIFKLTSETKANVRQETQR